MSVQEVDRSKWTAFFDTMNRSLAGKTVELEVMDTPGHTMCHVCLRSHTDQPALFCGDTLFALGCGRLFEGTAEQMHGNMARLAALPPATRIYCAHEYTLSNARFAVTVEPDNAALLARVAEVEQARQAGQPTVPTTIALERDTNPFMRAGSVEEFARRRAAKDSFKG